MGHAQKRVRATSLRHFFLRPYAEESESEIQLKLDYTVIYDKSVISQAGKKDRRGKIKCSMLVSLIEVGITLRFLVQRCYFGGRIKSPGRKGRVQQVLSSMASFGRSSSFDVVTSLVTHDFRYVTRTRRPSSSVSPFSPPPPPPPPLLPPLLPSPPSVFAWVHTRPDKNKNSDFHRPRREDSQASFHPTSFVLETTFSRLVASCANHSFRRDTFVPCSCILTNAKVAGRLFTETRSTPINKPGSFTGRTSIHCWPGIRLFRFKGLEKTGNSDVTRPQ